MRNINNDLSASKFKKKKFFFINDYKINNSKKAKISCIDATP